MKEEYQSTCRHKLMADRYESFHNYVGYIRNIHESVFLLVNKLSLNFEIEYIVFQLNTEIKDFRTKNPLYIHYMTFTFYSLKFVFRLICF